MTRLSGVRTVLLIGVVVGSLFAAVATVVAQWNEPTATPPSCPDGDPGCDAPLNVSDNLQTKGGPLIVNTAGAANGFSVAQGKMGVGTTSPNTALSVRGTVKATNDVCVANGMCLSSAGSGGGLWSENGSDIYYDSGNVGIGTNNPSSALEVSGNVTLQPGTNLDFQDQSNDGGSRINSLGTLNVSEINSNNGNSPIDVSQSIKVAESDGSNAIRVYDAPDANGSDGAINANGMVLGDNEIDGSSGLYLQHNSSGDVNVKSDLDMNNNDIDRVDFLDFNNHEWGHFSGHTGLYWDLSAGLYIRSYNAPHSNNSGRLIWSGENVSAGSNISISYDGEDRPTISASGGGGSDGYLPDDPASSNVNMNGRDIRNVDKLEANRVDPQYELNGNTYATYAPFTVNGLIEEYSGHGETQEEGDRYVHRIDFDDAKEGSELWVWREIVDFGEDTVEVIATPEGTLADIGYEIKEDENAIVFFSDEPTEFSFRLTGARYDHESASLKVKE